MNEDDVTRVGGRVSMAPISADAKNPMILPKNHHVATILIRFLHEVNRHCGVEQVLSLLREQFWVVKARGAIKRVLRSCVHCRKQMTARMNQVMGDLPRVGLTPLLLSGLFWTVVREMRKRKSHREALGSNFCLFELSSCSPRGGKVFRN